MSELQPEKEVVNHVLFVDDEPNILSALRRGLAQEKYKKFFAVNGQEALAIMEQHEVHILVTDMRMPGMSGLELLKIVSEKYPHVVKIVLSGYTQLPQVLATINQVNIYKFIPKPWNMEEEFIPMIRSAIDLYNMTQDYNHLKANLEKQNAFYQKLIKQNEERTKLLKSGFEHFNHFQAEIHQQIAQLFKQPKYAAMTAAQIGERLEEVEVIVHLFATAYPLEAASFTPEKLRNDLTLLILATQPKEDKPGHLYVGKARPGDSDTSFQVKHDGQQIALTGHYKLYLILQKVILSRLLKLHGLETLSVNQVYDEPNHTMLIQYECPADSLTPSPWDFQAMLLMVTHGHSALPGKFEISKSNDVLILKSTCTFAPKE